VAQRLLEPCHRVGLSFGGGFHASIGQITNPPVQAVTKRSCLREIAEADTLNLAADEKPAGDAHRWR